MRQLAQIWHEETEGKIATRIREIPPMDYSDDSLTFG